MGHGVEEPQAQVEAAVNRCWKCETGMDHPWCDDGTPNRPVEFHDDMPAGVLVLLLVGLGCGAGLLIWGVIVTVSRLAG